MKLMKLLFNDAAHGLLDGMAQIHRCLDLTLTPPGKECLLDAGALLHLLN